MTIAEKFFKDPRIQKAKSLITEALVEHQKELNSLKQPANDSGQEYSKSIERLSENRGGKLFYDYIGSGIGNGPFVELQDGSTKYDFITGIGVHFFGHSHPGLLSALIDGALSNTVMQGNLQQNSDSEKLIHFLLKLANRKDAGFQHCFLTSSGVMANENALKMAFQKRSPASRVIAFRRCFHGRTLSVAQITDKAKYRDGLPENLKVDYISFYDHKDHEGSIKKTLSEIDELLKANPNQYAAMICELIQGENGSWPGHTEYFTKIFEKLRSHGISIIDDEVQSFGRTDALFAYDYFNVGKLVDFVCIGKMSQVCATLFKEDHKPKPGLVSQTFTSSSTAINACQYILTEMVENNYLGPDGKINKVHSYFNQKLQALSEKHPSLIEGPFGVGAMIAMTLFGGDLEKSKEFTLKLYKNGVMSFIAGTDPVRVRMLIPIGSIENSHIDEVTEIIEKTLLEVKG